MKTIRVYDLPTRLFHATFSILFIAAFIIAKAIDDESAIYGYHMIFGMIMSLAVVLRIIWGFFGSEYAQFKSFVLNPSELIIYLKNAIQSKTKRYVGHNPGSSFAAVFMFACSLGLFFSGYNMVVKNYKYIFEEVHEILAHLFLILSVFHVLGIVLHTIKHQEKIGFSIIHGKKQTETSAIEVKNYYLVSILYIILIVSFSIFLFKNFDQDSGDLTLANRVYKLVDMD